MAIDFDVLVSLQDPQQKVSYTAEAAPTYKAAEATKKPPKEAKNLPPVMRVTNWDSKNDPTGWWVSEKYDGCRAWWDGKTLRSRQGNVFGAPDWFLRRLPNIPLDGELWLGRGRFAETSGLCRGGFPEDWKHMQYLVFDAPTVAGGFEDRLSLMHAEVQLAGFDQVRVVDQNLVKSQDHLLQMLTQVEKVHGEGLVLRRPKSLYVEGPSSDIQRVVRVRTSEAIVIGHTKGSGNRAGGCGALICRLADGTEFRIGTGLKIKDIQNPPPVGTMVTFGYKVLTEAGVPREPRFIRIRDEI